MCGIAGIFRFGELSLPDVEAVQRMLDAQRHRGPDDWGMLLPDSLYDKNEVKGSLGPSIGQTSVYRSNGSGPQVILGSRRLSILDLSARGRMPLSNSRHTTWVTHNGEIYNYKELRDELQAAGSSFTTNTDTESLINGYEHWGDEFLTHLRGMFGFALFDIAASRLILARDRFGIKPLYYAQQDEQIIFASEVRALMRSGLIVDAKEAAAAVQFLQLGSVPAPLTTVKNVFQLPAGHVLSVGPGDTKISRYWSLHEYATTSSRENQLSEKATVAATRNLLNESVRQHLLSDVPLGIFLSGGIDSSALVSLASPFQAQLATVSIVFDEQQYDERKYSRLMAQKYKTLHHEILLTHNDLILELPNIFAAMDQPTIDGVNSFFVSRAARQAGLKVVLSGLGGDEVFLGYAHLRRAGALIRHLRAFERLPASVRKSFIYLAIRAAGVAGRRTVDRLAYLCDPSDNNLYLLFRGLFAPQQIQRLLGLSENEMREYGMANGRADSAYANVPNGNFTALIDSFVRKDFQHYLQNQLLKDTDCMSMAHSIETRVPFLDHKLVEFVMQQPLGLKLSDSMNKPLLIKTVGDDLPREISDRRKMGFTFPFEPWLRSSVASLRPNGGNGSAIDKGEAEKIWRGFSVGKFHWSRPWALLVLEHWSI